MTDDKLHDLLEALARTAPEPARDRVADVHRRVGAVTAVRHRLVPALVAAATAAAVLLAAGVVVLTGSSHRAQPPAQTTSNQFEALMAGQRFARLFFSPDYRTISAYSDQVEAGSTGAFRSDFADKRSQLQSLLTQVHSVAQGRVLAAAARDLTPTSATVLLVADQDVRSDTTRGKPMTNRYRVAESLRLVDGRWLVAGLEPVVGSGPGAPGCPDATATADRNALLRQACAAVQTLYSYDYRHIDSDVAAQRNATTGPLQDQLVHETAPALRSLAPKTQAAVRVEVSAAAVEVDNGDTATVLMFVDQTVTSNLLATPRYDRNRLEVTMRRVDGRWLASDIKAL